MISGNQLRPRAPLRRLGGICAGKLGKADARAVYAAWLCLSRRRIKGFGAHQGRLSARSRCRVATHFGPKSGWVYCTHSCPFPFFQQSSPGVSSATARSTSTSSSFIFLVWTFRIASLPAESGTSTRTMRSNLMQGFSTRSQQQQHGVEPEKSVQPGWRGFGAFIRQSGGCSFPYTIVFRPGQGGIA